MTLLRSLCLALATMFALASAAAEEPRFNAGLLELAVPGSRPALPVAVWYPTETAETTWTVFLRQITAARNAPPAPGRFPLILLSHGSGGNEYGHADWADYLARRGFVVAAIRHLGDSFDSPKGRGTDVQVTGRPWQVRQALDALLADQRIAPSIDPGRIGMIGFSAGGYTTLVATGGVPKYSLWGAYCTSHPDDRELCPADGAMPPRVTRPGWKLPPPVEGIRAAVIMAPLGLLFDGPGLARVDVPVRIYRAENDRLVQNQWNADHVAGLLPKPPEVITVPGGHFIFIAPCPPALAAEAPQGCTDAAGIDRPAVHAQIAADLVDFFRRTLGP